MTPIVFIHNKVGRQSTHVVAIKEHSIVRGILKSPGPGHTLKSNDTILRPDKVFVHMPSLAEEGVYRALRVK